MPLVCAGCANFWDKITAKDFEIQSLWKKPNPLVVLQDSTDGDKRKEALLALREPSQHGGTKDEQEVIVKILTTAAISEHTPIARMAAIESLSKFKDVRASKFLVAAYYKASGYRTESGEEIKYTSDAANMIRCKALDALGDQVDPKAPDPEAVELLVAVVGEPKARGADLERQMVMDERIAATRSLSKINQPKATQALLAILKNEKDVALRDRAQESLEATTGKKLPVDYKAWDDALHNNGGSQVVQAKEESGWVKLMGFFQLK
jgi:HEAT repeat protein